MSVGVSEVPWFRQVGDVVAGLYEVAAVHGHGGQWTAGDEDELLQLLQLLQHAGYGWLRPEGIRSRLGRTTA